MLWTGQVLTDWIRRIQLSLLHLLLDRGNGQVAYRSAIRVQDATGAISTATPRHTGNPKLPL